MDMPFEPVHEEHFSRHQPAVPPFGAPGNNGLLRNIVDRIGKVNCLLSPSSAIKEESAVVNTAMATIREPNPLAQKVSVSNTSGTTVRVYESGIVVAVLDPGETDYLAERGTLQIEASALSGSAYLVVRTHERKSCGDPVENMALDTEPIGSFLL